MPQTDENKIFSDAYWNMHRNTLFFSVVCLIYAIPNVIIDGDISAIGIKVPELAGSAGASPRGSAIGNTIALIALMAAFYSYFAFFLEWREQAFRIWKVSRKSFFDRYQSLQSVHSHHLRILDSMVSLGATVESYRQDRMVNTAAEVRARINQALDRRKQFFNSAMGGGFDFGEWMDRYRQCHLPFQQVSDYSKENRRLTEQEFDKKLAEIMHSNMNLLYKEFDVVASDLQTSIVLKSCVNEISSFIEAYDKSILLKPSLFSIQYELTLGIARSTISISMDNLRIFWVGLFMPSVLWLIATFHLIGKYYFSFFPSWLPF